MSSESNTGIRANFASRLLSKAIAERSKTKENRKLSAADAAQYAAPATGSVETHEPAIATRD